MTMVGANADALDQAAAVLNAAADQLDADSAKLHRTLRGVSWLGAVATAFMHVFEGDHQPRLHTTANFIRDAARKLNTNARQQREASMSDGGGGRPRAWTLRSFDFAKRDFGNITGTFGAAKFALWMGKHAKVLGNIEADSKHLFHYSKAANELKNLKHLGTLASVVGVGRDAFGVGDALGKAHYGDATRKAISVTWTIAGTAFPPVGWAKNAWDGGYIVGKGGAAVGERVFHTQTNTVNYAAKIFGTKDIGTRYDGWKGFGNFMTDSLRIKHTFRRTK